MKMFANWLNFNFLAKACRKDVFEISFVAKT